MMLSSSRSILRLFRTQFLVKRRLNHTAAAQGLGVTQTKHLEVLFEKYKDKIEFNSYIEHEKLKLGYFKYYIKNIKIAKKTEAKEYADKCLPPIPLALKYYVDEEKLLKTDVEETHSENHENVFQLPYHTQNKLVNIDDTSNTPKLHTENSDIDKWMTSYEQFDDSELEADEESVGWTHMYGTPDPNQPISKVPCGGCGALLHCNDPAIPGYLPSEILKNAHTSDLQNVECQRCHFLKEYNVALDVNVQPEEYEKLLQNIKHVKSLVVLMVDLLDFPCSIWPGIVDIIGTERPIIIVGNKVDLLPGDSVGYMNRIRQSLHNEIKKTKLASANIKHIALISAKTGYGVENLISAMFKIWLAKGDVFLIGCTNVGKSSLFNALIQSDYCKVHAVDIVKRATVSRWPGTTLNLLKFPINRPSGWKIKQRTERLKADSRLMKMEKEIRRSQIEGSKYKEMPSLIGHIGRTFSDPQILAEDFNIGQIKQMSLNEKNKLFANSKWFYDTPGVIHPDQVLSLLTTEELLVTIPKNLIRPQSYYLKPGSTLFIGGLARIDFVDCDYPCRFTVCCSENLPVTVTKTEFADEIYSAFLGTDIFGAPVGGAERLAKWPGLKRHDSLLEFNGEGPKLCCGDVVLSSVGWVAVTAKLDSVCRVAAWTPGARGVHVRLPSLLPYAINLKGQRLKDTPAYMVGNVFIDDKYHDTYNIK